MTGYDIAKEYSKGNIIGWAEAHTPGLVQKYLNLCPHLTRSHSLFSRYSLFKGAKTMLYQVTRKVLGQDTENYAQLIGDCVSFGAKNAAEYVNCCDMLMRNEREVYNQVFTPYYYGTGRVYIGGWDNDYSDGSLGSYMADAVRKYGTLFRNTSGLPVYSGNVAKEWGAKRSVLDKWVDTAKNYLIKTTALIKSWDDLVVAISNGYPCTTASNVGYSMQASSDGFHRQNDSWAHQMCFIGIDDNDKDPYAILLNSWGDAHGQLKDLETGEELPMGCLRIRRKDAEKHIKAQETYAFSQYDAMKSQNISKELLKLG